MMIIQVTLKDPVDIGSILNVPKTFRRRLGRLLNVLCTFNLRPVSVGEEVCAFYYKECLSMTKEITLILYRNV